MDINVILPHFGVSGGIRSVIEITNRLEDRGHNVTLITSHYPPSIKHPTSGPIRKLLLGSYEAISRYEDDLDWLDIKPDIKKIPHLEPMLEGSLNKWIPNADCTIATAWETAYPVANLKKQKGEKYYFVQHYEIWPLWNDLYCWKHAMNLEGRPSLNFTELTPEDEYLKEYKRLVEDSYDLPLDIIITSEWENEILSRLGHDSVGKIKYGVDHDLFYPEPVEENKITILSLYRNSPEKGDEQAIKSFKQIYSQNKDVNFEMFGTKYSEKIPDFVNFYEDPTQSDIRSIYSKADIFVYPSWVEGFGMPPMEAMACKTALVSTDVGAVQEYTPEGSVQFVPVQKSEPIVSAVNELLANRKRIDEMKEECYNFIQNFTWETATDQFENCITDF